MTDTVEWGTRELPRWNTISISGYHIREAGSTAVQELAFTIADGIAYVEDALARGLRFDDFAPRLSFFFNSHNDFFEEIAKFRAARRIWYKLCRERFGAENERSTWMRFHTQTAGVSLTAQQPLNNLTRVAIQALAGVLGGTQSLHTDAYDEAWAVPSRGGRTARPAAAADPGRGVGRGQHRRSAGRLLLRRDADQPDRAGGVALHRPDRRDGRHGARAIEAGFPQAEIADAAYEQARELEAHEREIVGVTALRRPERGAAHPAARDQPRSRSVAISIAWRACAPSATPRPTPRAMTRLREEAAARRRQPHARHHGSGRRPTPRSARCAASCARSTASTGSRSPSRTFVLR